jgi:DNA-binding MarR family transcriptional regulator
MLTVRTKNQSLLPDLRAYLQDALGVDVQVQPARIKSNLPYFLQDAFDLHQLRIHDRELLLASARKRLLPSLSALRTQLDKLADTAGRPVVLLVRALASYERKRLVQQRVPFVVPGNQMYLPDLGIDFREYFRQTISDVNAFSPATQAMLLAALLHKDSQIEWQPAQVVEELDYTAMTLSRAVRELLASGLVTSSQKGRARWLRMKFAPAETWEKAKPYLRSPVKRVEWIHDAKKARLKQLPLAGLSALAHLTMLGDPPRPIYAVSAAQWKAAQKAGVELVEQQADSVQWEVWTYTPNLLKDSKTVDPLSLTLSLQDNADERVQQALTELKRQFPW